MMREREKERHNERECEAEREAWWKRGRERYDGERETERGRGMMRGGARERHAERET